MSAATSTAPPTFYCFGIDAGGVAVSAEINGISFAFDDTGIGISKVRTVNEWLKPAGNEMRFVLANSRDPRLGPVRARCIVFRAKPDGEIPEPAETLVEAVWPHPEAHPDELCAPWAFEARFDLAAPPPTRLFSDADRVEALSEADRREILELVARFRLALAEVRVEDAYDLAAYRYEEDARANGLDPAGLRRSVTHLWKRFATQPNAICPPLARDDAVLRVVGDGRLVHVLRGRSPEAVLIDGDEATIAIAVHVARIDGMWRIAR